MTSLPATKPKTEKPPLILSAKARSPVDNCAIIKNKKFIGMEFKSNLMNWIMYILSNKIEHFKDFFAACNPFDKGAIANPYGTIFKFKQQWLFD